MTSMDNTPDSPAETPDGCTPRGGNYWTLFTPEIWKVLHAVSHTRYKEIWLAGHKVSPDRQRKLRRNFYPDIYISAATVVHKLNQGGQITLHP